MNNEAIILLLKAISMTMISITIFTVAIIRISILLEFRRKR